MGVRYSIQADIYVKEVQMLSVSKQQNPDFTAKSMLSLTSKGKRGWMNGVQMIALFFLAFYLKPLNA